MRDHFTETLEVDLTEEERGIRGRQAARLALGIETWHAETKRLEDAWAETKKKRKEGQIEREEALFKLSRIVEIGKEEREVPCEEVLVGVMVETRRKGGERHGEFVSVRSASKDEMRGIEKPKPKGYTPEEKAQKLREGIARLTLKPRTEAAVLKALLSGMPEATPAEHKAAVVALLEQALLIEDGGKLAWIGPKPPGTPDDDGGIVSDDYNPATH